MQTVVSRGSTIPCNRHAGRVLHAINVALINKTLSAVPTILPYPMGNCI